MININLSEIVKERDEKIINRFILCAKEIRAMGYVDGKAFEETILDMMHGNKHSYECNFNRAIEIFNKHFEFNCDKINEAKDNECFKKSNKKCNKDSKKSNKKCTKEFEAYKQKQLDDVESSIKELVKITTSKNKDLGESIGKIAHEIFSNKDGKSPFEVVSGFDFKR